MEATQRAVLVLSWVTSWLLVLASGNIIVQPGYEQPSPKVGSPRAIVPKDIIVQPGYELPNPIVGSPHINSPMDASVLPNYEKQSPRVACSQVRPPNDVPFQPSYDWQVPNVGYPQVIPPIIVAVQPGYEWKTPGVEYSQVTPTMNIAAPPGCEWRRSPNEANPRIISPMNIAVQPGRGGQFRRVDCSQVERLRNIALVPGYEEQNPRVGYPQVMPPTNFAAQPANGQPISIVQKSIDPSWSIVAQPTVSGQSPGGLAAPRRDNWVSDQQGQLTMNDEFQRNQKLQGIVPNQVYWMTDPAELRQTPENEEEIVGTTLIRRPLFSPFHSAISHHALNRQGFHAFRANNFLWGPRPLLLRAADTQPKCADKIQYPRSVNDKSRADTGDEKLHEMATNPSVEKNNLGEVAADLPPLHNMPVDDSTAKKSVSLRQIGIPDDFAVGSPLDKIRFEEYESQQQPRPIIPSSRTSSIKNTTESIGEKIMNTIKPMLQSSGDGQQGPIMLPENLLNPFNSNDQPSQSPSSTYPGSSGTGILDAEVYHSTKNDKKPTQQYGIQPTYQPTDLTGYQEKPGRPRMENFNPSDSRASMPSTNNNYYPNFYGASPTGGSPLIYDPRSTASFMNQYGQRVMSAIPSTMNTFMAQPNAYLKKFYDSQRARVF